MSKSIIEDTMYRTTPLDDPAAWRGVDLANDPAQWTVTLTAEHVAELETAINQVARKELVLFDIQRNDFPLPTLSSTLSQLLYDLEGGRGFVRLPGLPATKWDEKKPDLPYG